MTDPAAGASLAELEPILDLVAEGVAEGMITHAAAEAGPRFGRKVSESDRWALRGTCRC